MSNLNSKTNTARTAISAETEQLQQRLWVKEQEATALKVQNRHLITKLEEAVKAAEPNQINTQQVSNEIQKQIRPLIGEIENALKESFDTLKSTMRGIYQQSQRAQQAVEDMSGHTRELELRNAENRKADQTYYQEKILSQVTSFGDRIERQLENRLKNLSIVELMNTKQNEVLSDIDQMKAAIAELVISNESLRGEIRNLRAEQKNTQQAQAIQATSILAEAKKRKLEAIQENESSNDFLKTAQKHIQEYEQNEAEEKKKESSSAKIILDHL